MCDKAVHDFLLVLKFVSDWFVTSKMIKMLQTALFADDHILLFDQDSGTVRFSSDEMGSLSIVLNNITLDEVNFDGDDPETIIHIRLMV